MLITIRNSNLKKKHQGFPLIWPYLRLKPLFLGGDVRGVGFVGFFSFFKKTPRDHVDVATQLELHRFAIGNASCQDLSFGGFFGCYKMGPEPIVTNRVIAVVG